MMVSTKTQLLEFIQTINDAEFLAVDTEFLRINTYYPEPCLIQLATTNNATIIDLKSGLDLEVLFDSIFDKTLVFHSARQDLEVLLYLSGRLPKKIFDTQIFASFLGYEHQVSYGDLVKDILGVSLDKFYSNYDWSKRPLPRNVLQYALDDVIYLIKLQQKFKDSDFYNYALEDSSLMLDTSIYNINADNAYKYLKGYGSLKDEQFALAAKICAYREKLAIKRNQPRKWLITDSAILQMVRTNRVPADIFNNLPQLIAHKAEFSKIPTLKERQQIKKYQKLFKITATEYNLPSKIFASKKHILSFIRGDKNIIFNQGWRREILKDLIKIKE